MKRDVAFFLTLLILKGVSHFEIVEDEYRRFIEAIQKSKPIPRMTQKHALVVKDIHDEICEYLNCVRDENNMSWTQLLGILLMLVEIERKKTDEQALEEWSRKKIQNS